MSKKICLTKSQLVAILILVILLTLILADWAYFIRGFRQGVTGH